MEIHFITLSIIFHGTTAIIAVFCLRWIFRKRPNTDGSVYGAITLFILMFITEAALMGALIFNARNRAREMRRPEPRGPAAIQERWERESGEKIPEQGNK